MGIQEIVADGQLVVAAVIALAAGLISFASPCVLPLVPGYLAYVGGVAGADGADAGTGKLAGGRSMTGTSTSRTVSATGLRSMRTRLVGGVLLFIAGFSTVFILMMALVGSVGVWLIEWEGVITRIMGLLVIAMGLVFVGLFGVMQRTTKLRIKPQVGLLGAPLLGAVFAVGWTPCLGPTLTTIMALSLQQGSVTRSVILAAFYCVGLGLPFILVALGIGWMASLTEFMRRHIRALNLIGGSLMILIGILMVSGIWSAIMYELQAVIGGYVTPL